MRRRARSAAANFAIASARSASKAAASTHASATCLATAAISQSETTAGGRATPASPASGFASERA
eukprot:4716401-Pyramimonas_sp.AAC.1